MSGPVFANVSPSTSFSIPPNTSMMFDVTVTGATLVLVVPIITVNATVAGERVYDWSNTTPALNGAAPGTPTNLGPGVFDAVYAKNSTLITITNGYRFAMRRLNGWATPPSLRVWAVDSLGNVSVL